MKFDDLPVQYQGNVEVQAPFDRHAGERPALSEADIADMVLFLKTLTDGYECGPAATPWANHSIKW